MHVFLYTWITYILYNLHLLYTQIYLNEIGSHIVEASKHEICKAGWQSRNTHRKFCYSLQVKSLLLLEAFLLWKPSTDFMRPTPLLKVTFFKVNLI